MYPSEKVRPAYSSIAEFSEEQKKLRMQYKKVKLVEEAKEAETASSKAQDEMKEAEQYSQRSQAAFQEAATASNKAQQEAAEALRKKIAEALKGFNSNELTIKMKNGKVYISMSLMGGESQIYAESGGDIRVNAPAGMFVNGNLENTQTYSGAYNVGLGGMRLGYSTWDGASGWWKGYLDDLRITKGYARYTANFTPPTQALITK